MARRDAPLAATDQAIHPVAGSSGHCPFLDEMLACSCAAAPSSKLIPTTLLAVRRCVGDSHRFCESYLERTRPRPSADAGSRAASPNRLAPGVAGIPIAAGVALAPNHMWLDVGSDGTCHVGVDAFLVRVLGAIDDVIFLSACGRGSPRLVLTVAGITLPLVFPLPVDITGINGALRRHLENLTADPYGRGWLYEGRAPKSRGGGHDVRTVRLRRGPDAETWMASEVRRLLRHVQLILSRRSSHLGPVAADGGEVSAALAQHLERTELLEVCSLFFSGAHG